MERWKTNKKFNTYEASTEGRIRNSKTGRIMKTNINAKGYEILTLRKDNRQYAIRVHRFIAETFMDEIPENMEVTHKDGDILNNKIENLELCTRREIIQRAFDRGSKKPSRMKRVRVIETGEEFESIRECGRYMGLDQSMICAQINGKAKHCGGYHFELVE